MTPVSPLRVLVVDDDAIVNQTVQNQITRLGLEVSGAAYDAEEALSLARMLRPDVVLLDMRMPNPATGEEEPEAGLKAAVAIQEKCPTAVVLLTAFESPDLVHKASACGISAYLLKPAKDAELDRALHLAVARFKDLQHLRHLNHELAHANEALARSEARFRGLAEAAPLGILCADAQGSITFLSEAWGRLLGLPVSGLSGDRLMAAIVPADRARWRALLRFEVAFDPQDPDLFQITTATGDGRWIRLHVAPLLDAVGNRVGVVGAADDVTERRRMRERQEQAQKRESLAVLAGGIAHDFNNLLTAMLGYLELAAIQVPEEGPLARYLAGIQEAVTRAGVLSRQMLAFAGRQTLTLEPLDLNAFLEALRPSLEGLLPQGVRLMIQAQADLPGISADPSQLQQVMQSLVINAFESLPAHRGSIRLSTGLAELQSRDRHRLVGSTPFEPGTYVALHVQDDGCGMDEATLARIFDPFFSTKFAGRGLGLPATQGILHAHHAWLQVRSQLNHGTTFTIYFPQLTEVALGSAVPSEMPVTPQPIPAASLRILMVDDEETLRESVAEYLEILGYEVIQAVDGLDAVEKFQALGGLVNLVILDLTMPRMDGHDAFLAIRELDPSVKVILSSGYTEQDATRAFIGAGLAAFLQKPYALKDLERLIEQVLHEKG